VCLSSPSAASRSSGRCRGGATSGRFARLARAVRPPAGRGVHCAASARARASAPPGDGARISRRHFPRVLGRAHEALGRNAIDLAAVVCLPAIGFRVRGSSGHEGPTRVLHAADEVIDGLRRTCTCAVGPVALPAALEGLGRLLDLWKPRSRHRAGRARCEDQSDRQGRLRAPRPRPAGSSMGTLASIAAAHGSSLSSRRNSADK